MPVRASVAIGLVGTALAVVLVGSPARPLRGRRRPGAPHDQRVRPPRPRLDVRHRRARPRRGLGGGADRAGPRGPGALAVVRGGGDARVGGRDGGGGGLREDQLVGRPQRRRRDPPLRQPRRVLRAAGRHAGRHPRPRRARPGPVGSRSPRWRGWARSSPASCCARSAACRGGSSCRWGSWNGGWRSPRWPSSSRWRSGPSPERTPPDEMHMSGISPRPNPAEVDLSAR